MSFETTNKFIRAIYNLLLTDINIQQYPCKVYLSAQQAAQYPFALLNLIKSVHEERPNYIRHELEFQLEFFVRSADPCNLFDLAELFDQALNRSLEIADVHVTQLTKNGVSFTRSDDNLTSKAIVKYVTILKESR